MDRVIQEYAEEYLALIEGLFYGVEEKFWFGCKLWKTLSIICVIRELSLV